MEKAMIEFQMGDKVKLKPFLDIVDLEKGKVYTVLEVHGSLIKLVGFNYYKSAHIFNKVNKERKGNRHMKEFIFGDAVRRTAKHNFGNTISGEIYQVLSGEPLVLRGCGEHNYDLKDFTLVEPITFKVGDRVKRIGGDFQESKFGEVGVVTSVSDGGTWLDIDGSRLQPYHSKQYCLVEDKQEHKFEVGDEVRRTHSSLELVEGEIYIVKKLFFNGDIPMIEVEGSSQGWQADRFELVEAELDGNEVRRIHPSLEVIEDGGLLLNQWAAVIGQKVDEYASSTNKNLVLSPQEVVGHFLAGDKLQKLVGEGERWSDCEKIENYRFHALRNNKFRLKPAGIIINGIEVPAPLKAKPEQEFIYFVNLFKSRVYKLPTKKLTFNHVNCWATEQDANQVLAALQSALSTESK